MTDENYDKVLIKNIDKNQNNGDKNTQNHDQNEY